MRGRALVIVATAVLLAVGLAPTRAADVGPPAWWNGDCDATNWNAKAAAQGWTGAGAHRLGAVYLGVPVCGPRPGADGAPDVQWSRSGWGHFEWQCTELAHRFMAQIYGVTAYGGNGNAVVRNYRASYGGNLETVANGTPGKPPLPGDVISFDRAGAAGHVVVVATSAVDANGNGSIRVLTQNDTADGWRTLAVSKWTVQGFGSYVPYGWLHDPAGRGGPTLGIDDLSWNEGAPDTLARPRFSVRLTAPTTVDISVRWRTVEGTATPGADYKARSGTVVIPAGQTTASLGVVVMGDGVLEPDETFTVVLSQPSGAGLADDRAVGTILNDD